MKKRCKVLQLLVILSFCFFSASAQPPLERYNIVILNGNLVKDILTTYSETFALFDFTFKELPNKTFSLVATARDHNNNQLGDAISLATMAGQPTRPLKNLERGHLYLRLETMQQNNVDGLQNYVLTPKKCKDKSGDSVDYVSYRFSNRPDNTTSNLFSPRALISFELNPSPPYE